MQTGDQPRPELPVLVWVAAFSTDAGKTEIAAGLVRLLNKMGVPALGFKPYGGMPLFHSIDLMVDHFPQTEAKLYGGDAIRLVEASPLTDETHLEVVAPSYRLSWPVYTKVVLVRSGSHLLGDRQFFKTQGGLGLWKRADIAALVRKMSLPVNDAATIVSADPRRIDAMAQDKQQAAFAYLKALGPRVIVCEGAGKYLPVWRGSPAVNHILLINQGVVYLFPFVNMNISNEIFNSVPSVTSILNALKQRKVFTSPIWLSVSDDREKATERLVHSLIKESGILQMASASAPVPTLRAPEPTNSSC
jgi:hypothetical protein